MSSKISYSPYIAILFPKTQYSKQFTQTEECLHYLIALNQPLSTINSWINSPKIKENSKLLSHRAINELSPLDLCAILGRVDVATSLIEKGVDSTKSDNWGRTPFHYAFLAQGKDSEIFRFLETTLKTDSTIEILLRGTSSKYLHLDNLLHPPSPKSTDLVFYYQSEEGSIVQGTAEKFQEMTGAQYTDQVSASEANLLKDWLEPFPKSAESSQIHTEIKVKNAYLQAKKNLPRLYLAKDKELGKSVPELGYDVYAGQDISGGVVISLFSGEQMGKVSSPNKPYQLSRTDGEYKRNLSCMINHGFPNVTACPVYSTFGFSLVNILFSLEKICKGDRLCISYEREVILDQLSGKRVELRKTPLETFIHKVSIPSLFDKTMSKNAQTFKNKKSIKLQIMETASYYQLHYILEDPYAFRHLLEEKKADRNYLLKISEMIEKNDIFIHMIEVKPKSYLAALSELCKKTAETESIDENLFARLLDKPKA